MTSPGLGRKFARIGLIVAIPVIPGLVFTVVGRSGASTIWTLGSMTGLLAVLYAGPRIALATAGAMSLASAIACLVWDQPWLALVLMAACAGATGLMARRGLSTALVMAPITVGFMVAEPPRLLSLAPFGSALLTAGVMLLAAGWGVLVGAILGRKVHLPVPGPASHSRALAFAITIGAMAGIAAWFVSDLGLAHGGAWLLMTILVVMQPYLKDTWTKTLQRAGGTVVGFCLALALARLVPWQGVLYVVGALFIVAALVLRSNPARPYWQYVALLTPAIVLLEGASTSVVQTDVTRLTFTLVGAGAALVVTALQLPFYRRSAAGLGVAHH